MKLKLLLLSAFAAIASLAAKANTNPGETESDTKKNDISGGVFHSESRKPLNNVSVTAYLVSRKEKIALTDENGSYAFDDLKPGTYKLVFEKQGYKKVTKEKVLIKTDEGFELNIAMVEEKDFDFMPGAFSF